MNQILDESLLLSNGKYFVYWEKLEKIYDMSTDEIVSKFM